jgi:hypothetical protein
MAESSSDLITETEALEDAPALSPVKVRFLSDSEDVKAEKSSSVLGRTEVRGQVRP